MSQAPHRRLIVWQKAVELVILVYELTKKFPQSEQYGLTSQMKRAAVSGVSNIAEGAARLSSAEKMHFFLMSRGSLSELDTQIEIALRLRFLVSTEAEKAMSLIEEINRMINGLIESRRRNKK